MTGGLVSFTLSLYEHWRGTSLAANGFSILALTVFFWGAYRAWAEADTENQILKRIQLPDISITLHSVSIAGSHDLSCSTVLTILSVRNTGAPSIVDTWQMTSEYPGIRIEKVTPPESLTWRYPNKTVTYPAIDQLQRKVAEQPVPTGGKRVGYMLWNVFGLDLQPFEDKTKKVPPFTVSARDIRGNLIIGMNKALSFNDDGGYYYAGMQWLDARDSTLSGKNE